MIKKHILCLMVLFSLNNISSAQDKAIAITIDDLPFVGSCNNDPVKLNREHDRFMKILNTLAENKVPATGFVIANSIERGQWQLLEDFKRAGFNIGNHTYSHKSLDRLSAAKYIEEIDKADKILTPLFTYPKYFRYPYLAEGHGQKRQQVYDYLAKHHYVIAPVTIDSKDFLFNKQLFAIPYRLREQNLNQMKKRYLTYIWKQTLRAEQADKNNAQVTKQILLIHANLLNSHFIGDIISLYRDNGYRFITLEEALNLPPREKGQEQEEAPHTPINY